MLFINNLEKFSKENLCIITDFDKTLTTHDSDSSIGVFSKFLPKQYNLLKNQINQIERELSLNSTLSRSKKIKYEYDILGLKLRLLSLYINDDKILKEIAYSDCFHMRDSAIDTLNYLRKKYRVIINSSGFENIIKEILKKNGCIIDNIEIVSNYINLKCNNSIDYSNIIISSCKRNKKYNILTRNIKNCLLVGDSLEDLTMKPINSQSYSIGFLDSDYKKHLDTFKNNFDIVATDNESYDSPIKILNL